MEERLININCYVMLCYTKQILVFIYSAHVPNSQNIYTLIGYCINHTKSRYNPGFQFSLHFLEFNPMYVFITDQKLYFWIIFVLF